MDNREIIETFAHHRFTIDRVKTTTIRTEKIILISMDNKIKKPFKDVTEQDILDYLAQYKEGTRDSRINHIKLFYRWLFKLEKGDRLPDCIRRIKPTPYRLKRQKGDIESRERRITPIEYQRLVDCAHTIMHKALLEALYHFGPRISELLSMNATDVSYDGSITKVTFRESKTQARDAVCIGRLNHLLTWSESYQPFKGQKDKPLWVDHRTNNRYASRSALTLLQRICERAGVQKRTLHDFRHTSISNDRDNGIPITHIETNHGFAKGSPMMRIYDHNKTSDYEEYLKRKNTETAPTYETLQKQKNIFEEKLNEITTLKEQMNTLIALLKFNDCEINYGELLKATDNTAMTDEIKERRKKLIERYLKNLEA
jgi:site-specific recombinase XerD